MKLGCKCLLRPIYQQYTFSCSHGFLSNLFCISYVFLLVYETQNPYQLHDTGDVYPCEPKPAECDPPLLISGFLRNWQAQTILGMHCCSNLHYLQSCNDIIHPSPHTDPTWQQADAVVAAGRHSGSSRQTQW